MASIYLAIKIHSPKKVTIRSIASTGNGLITTRHMEAMELSIMKSLDWHLHPPTAVAFLENFYPLLAKGDEMADCLEFSRFLSELSACAYPFVSAKPSSIAVAAILYSLEYFGQHHSEVSCCRKLMEELGLDVGAEEVEACGALLNKVHRLAMPNRDN
mmetsp:Transcript_26585/g.50405  ORF Transcript_26585/g.50405 Transcript_26585/m.50405 type:complete len:158 (+) Transcript_26585:101-574(+)|eukprot:CAMPEP_0201663654 /NCGR_PEP_ID=MMETSP0494-20130426/5380_1 /ASSEMBLY_ACC=CAM_ASM_000839 /TAXON_ID=420259 /ORGANISM="Thalassiosira gravida, Strain GMp14c1" /LENGTH=157 /DNA_ID=CAMNT_0048142287 /DNA_START=86 /DNA_END=559 /DNA_ORIENTATION=+